MDRRNPEGCVKVAEAGQINRGKSCKKVVFEACLIVASLLPPNSQYAALPRVTGEALWLIPPLFVTRDGVV